MDFLTADCPDSSFLHTVSAVNHGREVLIQRSKAPQRLTWEAVSYGMSAVSLVVLTSLGCSLFIPVFLEWGTVDMALVVMFLCVSCVWAYPVNLLLQGSRLYGWVYWGIVGEELEIGSDSSDVIRRRNGKEEVIVRQRLVSVEVQINEYRLLVIRGEPSYRYVWASVSLRTSDSSRIPLFMTLPENRPDDSGGASTSDYLAARKVATLVADRLGLPLRLAGAPEQ